MATYTLRAAGGDYTSLDTWEADTDNDLVTAEEIETIQVDGVFAVTTVVAGATTNASYYRRIEGISGGRHDGTNASGAALNVSTNGGTWPTLWLQESFVQVAWLRMGRGAGTSGSNYCFRFQGSSLLIESVVGYGTAAAPMESFARYDSGTGILVRNSCGHNMNAGIEGPSGDTDAITTAYCTFVRVEEDANNGNAGLRYVLAKNCACFHFGGSSGFADYLNLDAGSSNNASSDATGSSGLQSLTGTDEFVDLTDDAMDLHLQSGSTLEAAGTPVAGTTTDVDGDTRDGSTPDVGFDELAAGGGITMAGQPVVVTPAVTAGALTVQASISVAGQPVVVTPAVPAGSFTKVVHGAPVVVTPAVPAGSLTVQAPTSMAGQPVVVTPAVPQGALTITVSAVMAGQPVVVTPAVPQGSFRKHIAGGAPVVVTPAVPTGALTVQSSLTMTGVPVSVVPGVTTGRLTVRIPNSGGGRILKSRGLL